MWLAFWSLKFWYAYSLNFCRHLLLFGQYVRGVLIVGCPAVDNYLNTAMCFFIFKKSDNHPKQKNKLNSSFEELWLDGDRERLHSFFCKWKTKVQSYLQENFIYFIYLFFSTSVWTVWHFFAEKPLLPDFALPVEGSCSKEWPHKIYCLHVDLVVKNMCDEYYC